MPSADDKAAAPTRHVPEGEATGVAQLGYAATPAGRGAARLESGPLDALLPGVAKGFVLPFLLAALRPDARLWLGSERFARLAGALRLSEPKLALQLDASPQPTAELGEAGAWIGRSVPCLGRDGGADWIEMFWRPDRARARAGQGPAKPDRGSFAVRLVLPVAGRIEIRGRLEGIRLDAVLEAEHRLPRRASADMVDSFAAILSTMQLVGELTIRSGRQARDT